MATVYFPQKEGALVKVDLIPNQKAQIFHLQLINGEQNRFDPNFISAINLALDHVEKTTDGPSALVTSSTGKFFSNGLNLDFLLEQARSDPKEEIHRFLDQHYYPLLSRMLTFRLPTVCFINGHAFAGGMLFALVHDYRVMKKGRGFLCMNEILLPTRITHGLVSVLRAKLPNTTWIDVTVAAKRYTAEEAHKLQIVREVADDETEGVAKAVQIAEELAPRAQAGEVVHLIKKELYIDAVTHLSSPSSKL
eukprot:TRINITY_DN2903_c0_g1_i1.p1 TRINITY_DN2903_c0_g1~~TRINITY_DN2903_c0_g1_i1.p1  ORF type:complete len:269 (-),score=76.92 TRINITY_DN2903_c0_g1_i1:128-877(-)